MSFFKISEEEWTALMWEPPHLFKLYCGIRRKMDFNTFVAGGIKKVNCMDEQYFREVLAIETIPGRKMRSYRPTRDAIRAGIKRLENLGLIKYQGSYIFDCVLAREAEIRSKEQHPSYNQAATRTTTKATTQKKEPNNMNNKEMLEEQQPDQQPELNQTCQGAAPHLWRSGSLDKNRDISNEISLSRSRASHRFIDDAKSVIAFLNEKTGRNYRATETNLKFVIARLKSGATVIQCRQVIAKKFREWSTNPEMEKYLRPATLFNATKFEQYLGELVVKEEPDASLA